MPRLLCLDIGTARIGAAVSDPLGSFAQGLAVWDAQGDWMAELKKVLDGYGTRNLLLGLPIREDGSEGPSAQRVRAVASEIQEAIADVKIRYWDERYSTRTATEVLLQGELSRRKRKGHVDKVAAAVILQSYIDAQGVEDWQ